jgi:hypothetical protein
VKRVLQILKPVVIPGVGMSVLQNVHEYIVKNLPGLIVCVCGQYSEIFSKAKV